jgi:predicted nucleic acid-binding protein
MILIDTSVMVRYLRTADTKIASILGAHSIAISVVTRIEILHGARNDVDYDRLSLVLDGFKQIEVDSATWDELARTLYHLRLRGILVPFPDAIIATASIREGLEIWSYDNHFQLMQPVLSAMRLFVEPP